MSMDRRDFLKTVGAGTAAVAAGVASPDLAHAGVVSITLNQAPKLKSVGGWTIIKLQGKKVLLMRVSTKRVRAVNPKCRHKGCIVGYVPAKQVIKCGCHGSKYTPKGKVLNGPATQNLFRYKAKLKGNTIFIKL